MSGVLLGFLGIHLLYLWFTDSLGLWSIWIRKGLGSFIFSFRWTKWVKKDDDRVNKWHISYHNLKGISSFQLIDLRSKTTKLFKFEDSKNGLEETHIQNSIYLMAESDLAFPSSLLTLSNKDRGIYQGLSLYFGIYHLDSQRLFSHFGSQRFPWWCLQFKFLESEFFYLDQTIYLNMKNPRIFFLTI